MNNFIAKMQSLIRENETLGNKNKKLRQEVKLWRNRVDEAAECIKDFEVLQAENKTLKEKNEIFDSENLMLKLAIHRHLQTDKVIYLEEAIKENQSESEKK